MSTIIIPAQQIKVELEDASIDLVCFEYAHGILNDRTRAGKITGYVEATLAANPGLAGLGAILPRGTIINLPEFTIKTEQATKRLWD